LSDDGDFLPVSFSRVAFEPVSFVGSISSTVGADITPQSFSAWPSFWNSAFRKTTLSWYFATCRSSRAFSVASLSFESLANARTMTLPLSRALSIADSS
jgi:hypothetical protein